jgi:hypothetical protein
VWNPAEYAITRTAKGRPYEAISVICRGGVALSAFAKFFLQHGFAENVTRKPDSVTTLFFFFSFVVWYEQRLITEGGKHLDINKLGGVLPQNAANNAKVKADAPAVSFQDFLQQKLQRPQAQGAAQPDSLGLEALYRASGIEAVSARARIQQATGGDVSDFLGLITQDKYLASQDIISQLNSGITAEDAQKLGLSVFPKQGDLMDMLLGEAGFTDLTAIDPTDTLARLEAMISNERFTYDYVLGKYGKQTTSVLELADSHTRVLDALKSLGTPV